ncbi:MAG: hypothetical protein WCK34_12960 [Bacteroidota bacterium]
MKTRMLILVFAIAVVPVLFLLSCSKAKDAVAFDYTYKIPRTTFIYTPGIFKSGEQLIYSGTIRANLDSILNANGFSSGVVGTTTFSKCSITLEQPDTLTFSWLGSARGVISATADFNPEQEVGTVTNTDPLAKTVVLTTNNGNIRPYLGSRNFYFRLYGVLNKPLPVAWAQMYLEGQLVMHLQPLN